MLQLSNLFTAIKTKLEALKSTACMEVEAREFDVETSRINLNSSIKRRREEVSETIELPLRKQRKTKSDPTYEAESDSEEDEIVIYQTMSSLVTSDEKPNEYTKTYRSSVYNNTKKTKQAHRGNNRKIVNNKIIFPLDEEELKVILANDAQTIKDALGKETRASSSTTVVTFAVRTRNSKTPHREYQYYGKKYVASNHPNLPPKAREKAEELGYHVIKAGQAHAEGQMMQFLTARKRNLALSVFGVDKAVCAECGWALDLYLYPENWEDTTQAERSTKVYKNWYLSEEYSDALDLDNKSDNAEEDDSSS